jgi:hypothetical protein
MILSLVMFVGMTAYLWYLYKQKKKNGDSYKIEIKNILVLVFFNLLSGSLFVYSLLDLPNVLANKTEQYNGDCEVWVFESARGGHTSVQFQNHNVMFPNNYKGAEEGSYYCEVEYYPRTEMGKSLKLYSIKDGELLNSK